MAGEWRTPGQDQKASGDLGAALARGSETGRKRSFPVFDLMLCI